MTATAYPVSSTVAYSAVDGNDPSVPFPAYERNKARWELCDMVFTGTDAIRAAGTGALAQYTNESDARYAIRKQLAAFYNVFAKTVLACVGYLLKPEPTFDRDMPAELVKMWENVDGAGTHGAVFARKLATTGLIRGYAGIFTDYTQPGDARLKRGLASFAARVGALLSGDDERRLGLRPYFVLVRADDIINPYYETIGGERILTTFVRRECTTERKGLFGRTPVEKFRVYNLLNDVVTATVYVKRDGQSQATLEGEPIVMRNITEIPWSPFIAGEELVGDDVLEGEIKPPLYDLAHLNLQYHATLTNILALEKDALVPTPVRVGATADATTGLFPPVKLGPGNTIEVPHMDPMPAQPVYWLSPDVSVLDPAAKTLEKTAEAMDTAGGAFMAADPAGVESADAKRIKGAAQRATLGSVQRALKDCFELAYRHAGQFSKVESGSMHFNEDFSGIGTDTNFNKSLAVPAYTAGIWTLEESRTVMATGELPEGYDANEVEALVSAQLAKEDAEAEAAKAALAAGGVA